MAGFHKGPMGFQMDLENGWTISVQFGIGNYCSNRDGAGNPFKDIPDFLDSETAEIAAWRTDSRGRDKGTSTKEWYTFEHGEQVDGWQTPHQVLEFINLIARKPNVGDEAGVIDVKASKILQDAYANPPANNWDNLPGAYDPVEPIEYKLCYVCDEEVLATDKECHKYIDGVYKYRHLWHGVPGITRAVGGGGGFNGYAKTLELARQRAEYYINSNPYAAPEVKQGEQEIMDEVNRLENKGGEYISECCDATPIGELDSGSPYGGTEYYRVGFCSKCKDNAVFIKEELV